MSFGMESIQHLHAEAKDNGEADKGEERQELQDKTDHRNLSLSQHRGVVLYHRSSKVVLTQCPIFLILSPSVAVIPPPAACRKKVSTSLQTKIRTIFLDEKKRQSSASSQAANLGRIT